MSIKHHAMMIWGSGGTAPHIPNLRMRWRWVVNFTPGHFTSGKEPPVPPG